MKLRFDVDQAEAFRQGVDVPKSIVTVEVNPADLPQEERTLIADRLVGIDVCERKMKDAALSMGAVRLKATLPTFEALMVAVRADEREYAAHEERGKRLEEERAIRFASQEAVEEHYAENPRSGQIR